MKHYETVIGLEIHVELKTKSKIFCGCEVSFGLEPNTCCCPVCTGMPGSLPVLNKKVLDFAILVGIATNCDITRNIKFDRKNYFYPDLPKAYQISQLFYPICMNGYIEIIDEKEPMINKRVGIHEIHMEEDAGKLIHDPFDDVTLVDYNRCGIPLLEIVSEPDIRSAKEAIVYIEKIKSILEYLEVSDCKMQEGSMRVDINLSVRELGDEILGTRTEMKNMNSLKSIYRAIENETKRQIELIESNKKIIQETRRWDENKDLSFSMRGKENANDYRYFPEPDLLPFIITENMVQEAKSALPELIDEKKARYKKDLELPDLDINILTSRIKLAKLFEETISFGLSPKEISNWIMGDVLQIANNDQIEIADIKLNPESFAKMIELLNSNKINRNSAKKVLAELMVEDFDPQLYVEKNSLTLIDNDDHIEELIDKVLENNIDAIKDYKAGKIKAFSYLVGQVMKESKGKASPDAVNKLLKNKLTQSIK